MAAEPLSLHPLHRLWRRLPASRRRLWLAQAASILAPKPDRAPPASAPGLVVAGEIARASGLGEVARLIQSASARSGVATWLLEAGLPVPGEGRSADLARGSDTAIPPAAALLLHVNAPVLPGALLRLPRSLLRGRRVIGYWAWELQTVPPSWHPACRLVHEVWAPSQFTARALEPLLPGRVRVVPPPVACSPPVPARLGREQFGLPVDAVVVLVSFSLASAFERKNPLGALAAFRKAFGNRSDRILVLKVGHAGHSEADMRVLRDAVAGQSNIRLETRILPRAESHALTASCDIVLSLHRSEGFGLVPAEAMLLGRPVMATGWSATTEFLDAGCGVPVGFRLVEARDPRGIFEAAGAVWAEPDTDEAAAALRTLADDPDLRGRLGRAGRQAAERRLGAGPLLAALAGIGIDIPSPGQAAGSHRDSPGAGA